MSPNDKIMYYIPKLAEWQVGMIWLLGGILGVAAVFSLINGFINRNNDKFDFYLIMLVCTIVMSGGFYLVLLRISNNKEAEVVQVINEQLVKQEYAVTKNESWSLPPYSQIESISKEGEIAFYTQVNSQGYLSATIKDETISNVQFASTSALNFKRMIQVLREQKVKFYELEKNGENKLTGITEDQKAFEVSINKKGRVKFTLKDGT